MHHQNCTTLAYGDSTLVLQNVSRTRLRTYDIVICEYCTRLTIGIYAHILYITYIIYRAYIQKHLD